MTFSLMPLNKYVLSIKNASNHNDQHCPNHRSDEGKIVPEIQFTFTSVGKHYLVLVLRYFYTLIIYDSLPKSFSSFLPSLLFFL